MYKSKKPYVYGTGRRKSSVARVHLIPNGTGAITINGRDIDDYFGLETLKLIVRQPLVTTGTTDKVDIEATVTGGGVTGWIGGLKETKARVMMDKRSDYAMELAIKGMLPKNAIGRNAMTRLHLYKGAEHPHAAQKPEAWTLD